MAELPRYRRRWFRFSLRTFLLAITVLCIWLSIATSAARKQRAAVEAIRKAGGEVAYSYQRRDPAYRSYDSNAPHPAPAWLRKWLGDDLFQTAVDVSFFGKSFPEVAYRKIAELPHLQSVSIAASKIVAANDSAARLLKDDDLAVFAKLTELDNLALNETNINGPGLANLKGLKNLRILRLSESNIDDAGFAHLKDLKKIYLLQIGQTRLTDAGLAAFDDMTGLEILMIDSPAITPNGLQRLASKQLKWLSAQGRHFGDSHLEAIGKITSLETLIVGSTAITDDGLKYLKDLSNLTQIVVRDTKISDAGIPHLTALPKLGRMSLKGSKISPAGIQELRTAFPKLDIYD